VSHAKRITGFSKLPRREENIAGLFAGLWVPQSPTTPFLITLRSGAVRNLLSYNAVIYKEFLVTPAGIEPATFSLEVRRSNWKNLP
jgi:hypothetical protein